MQLKESRATITSRRISHSKGACARRPHTLCCTECRYRHNGKSLGFPPTRMQALEQNHAQYACSLLEWSMLLSLHVFAGHSYDRRSWLNQRRSAVDGHAAGWELVLNWRHYPASTVIWNKRMLWTCSGHQVTINRLLSQEVHSYLRNLTSSISSGENWQDCLCFDQLEMWNVCTALSSTGKSAA